MALRRLAPLGLAVVIGVLFVPFGSRHAPAWEVTVVDEAGQPVAGATVRLSYTNYSAESESHELDRMTDEHGQVSFAEQALYASPIQRLYYALRSARTGTHASFGPQAYVTAFGKGMQGFDEDKVHKVVAVWTGEPSRMQSRIILRDRT